VLRDHHESGIAGAACCEELLQGSVSSANDLSPELAIPTCIYEFNRAKFCVTAHDQLKGMGLCGFTYSDWGPATDLSIPLNCYCHAQHNFHVSQSVCC